ncbi:hypothetical protein BH23BAC2_BH23BAC2_01850 [soil metagenome]
MRVFKEKQRFNQWWLYAIYVLVLAVLITGIYKNSDGFTNFHNPVLVLFFVACTIPMAVILWMQLVTRIDNEGIRVKFSPLGFSEKFFSWKEIEECYVRKYHPLAEYGGWGIRSLGRKKAYNISGNLGIQIVTRDKNKFLIGTSKPDEARAVIQNYEHKINHRSKKH